MEAYLDNSATTKCAREVVETVVKAMQDDYGNPSSKHMKGVDAEQYIKQAAATIARSLKCQEKELVFTSGGTESNNMAIIGTAMANKGPRESRFRIQPWNILPSKSRLTF